MKYLLKALLLALSASCATSEIDLEARSAGIVTTDEATPDSVNEFQTTFLKDRELKLEDLMISEQMMTSTFEDSSGVEDVDAPRLRRRLEWSEGHPRAAWLLSFPESGVAHVMNILQQSSGQRTATNYGHLFLMSDGTFSRSGDSALVYPNGPAWYNMELQPPTAMAATRTHGTGYCLFCHPRDYFYGNFWWKSASGMQMKQGAGQKLQYNPADVKRMAHLIRDPYDNVVARFYSYVGLMNANRPDLNIEETFPLSEKGFKAWCEFQDKGFERVELKWLPEHVRGLAKDVPCRQEFVKYALFHSNAYLMARHRDIAYGVFRYEDYVKDQSGAIDRINKFFGYEVKNLDIPQTIAGDGIWNFKSFYTDDERLAIERLIRNLSVPPIWFHIMYYTPQYYTDPGNNDPDFHRINDVN